MIKLNLARNCLRYIIRLYDIKEIYIPHYCCNTIWHAINLENCKIKFYHIGKDFLPAGDFPKNSFILYINYFGLCDENCTLLAEKYPNIIIDNTQAFYSEIKGFASFNSLRKFFKVQNGAYLYTNNICELSFEIDNLNLPPVSMQEDYQKFLQNELLLDKENIKLISTLVEKYMDKINFDEDKKIRLSLFDKYHTVLKDFNMIKLTPANGEIPYCYPFSSDNNEILTKLNNINIPLLHLWKEFPKDFSEYEFLNNTVALPLDIQVCDIILNKLANI